MKNKKPKGEKKKKNKFVLPWEISDEEWDPNDSDMDNFNEDGISDSDDEPSSGRLHTCNEAIRSEMVYLTCKKIKVSKEKAIEMARAVGKDLMQVNARRSPPFCVLQAYEDFAGNIWKRQQQKKRKAKDSKGMKLKQMRFGTNIASNDRNIKMRKIREFFARGHPVKIEVGGPDVCKSVLLLRDLADHVKDMAHLGTKIQTPQEALREEDEWAELNDRRRFPPNKHAQFTPKAEAITNPPQLKVHTKRPRRQERLKAEARKAE